MILDRVRLSVMARTTLVVLAVTVFVGVVADNVAVRVAHKRELANQRQSMEALLDVVQPSAEAAAFVNDATLAQQVVQGLAGTRSVRFASIKSGEQELARALRAEAAPPSPDGPPIARALKSPFDAGSSIGTLVLEPDAGETARLTRKNVELVRISIFGLTLALGLAMAATVNHFITRPITSISHRLHDLEATTGARLLFPAGHEADEIGQLVQDVNALIEKLVDTLQNEQKLSTRLGEDRQKIQAILDNVATGIFVVHQDGAMEAWTPAFLELLDLRQVPPPKGAYLPVYFGLHGTQIEEALAACTADGVRKVETFCMTDFQGQSSRWVRLTLDPIAGDWIQGLLEDVTTFQEATHAAEERATHDPLTGVLNRLGAERAFAERSAKVGSGMAVMLVDLDLFKAVNDTFGHDAGDEVLKQATLRMKTQLRQSDVVARLGGDEFLLMVEHLTPPEIALAIAEKVIAALRVPIPLPGGKEARIGGSVGIAQWSPAEGGDWDATLKRADLAMYQAKQAGRNCARLAG